MPVMDEFQAERDAMKNRSPKERLQNFWYYHKWYILGGGAIAIFIIALIYSILTRQETAFRAIITDVAATGDEQTFTKEFADYSQIDTNTYAVYMDSSVFLSNADSDGSSKISTLIFNGELDTLVCDEDHFNFYAYDGNFADLRDYMSQEELDAYEGNIYYLDQDLFDKNYEHSDDWNYAYEYAKTPLDKSSMKNPVPVGIRVSASSKLKEMYTMDGTYFIGIPGNAKHIDKGIAFIKFCE